MSECLIKSRKAKRTVFKNYGSQKAVENEPWETIVENKEAQKSLKLRRCKNES